jgi:hypothetical protein
MTANRAKITGLFVACIAAVVMMLPANANAQEIGNGKNLGIGVAGGYPAGSITGKYYLDQKSAIQGFLGFTYFGGYGLSADYLYEFATLTNPPEGRLFVGAGGGAGFFGGGFGYSIFTINGVFELGWHFADVPLELVLDVRPVFGFGVGPSYSYGSRSFNPYLGGFGIGGSGAIRFYF